MRRYALLLTIVAIVMLAGNAYCWDGKREGFLLGFGLGAGSVPALNLESEIYPIGDEELSWLVCEEGRRVMFMTDFRIGYAPDNHWQVLYINKVFWFMAKSYSWDYWDYYMEDAGSDIAGIGLTGICVAYAFEPEAPSPYVTVAMGIATLSKIAVRQSSYEDDYTVSCVKEDPEYGPGFMGGFGYEFARGVSLEADLAYLAPSKASGWNGLSLSLALTLMGY